MRDAADLDPLRKLARVQTVLTADAAAALADARDAERAADLALERDRRSVEQAARHWYAHLGGPLDPERSAASAAALLDREREMTASEAGRERAVAWRIAREEAWQAADAADRATDKVLRARIRYRRRKAEERALDATSDRATADWMRK